MNKKLKAAIVSLRISQVIYILVAAGLIWAGFSFKAEPEPDMARVTTVFVIALFAIPIVALIEFIVRGLQAHKFWAWVLAISLGGIYFFSLFFPLGAVILWGVLSRESKELFIKP